MWLMTKLENGMNRGLLRIKCNGIEIPVTKDGAAVEISDDNCGDFRSDKITPDQFGLKVFPPGTKMTLGFWTPYGREVRRTEHEFWVRSPTVELVLEFNAGLSLHGAQQKENDVPKIFAFSNIIGGGGGECLAVAEDGKVLASHWCSNEAWASHDLGVTSDWKHEHYQQHYPDGYEMEFVASADFEKHAELQAALKLMNTEPAQLDVLDQYCPVPDGAP